MTIKGVLGSLFTDVPRFFADGQIEQADFCCDRCIEIATRLGWHEFAVF